MKGSSHKADRHKEGEWKIESVLERAKKYGKKKVEREREREGVDSRAARRELMLFIIPLTAL